MVFFSQMVLRKIPGLDIRDRHVKKTSTANLRNFANSGAVLED